MGNMMLSLHPKYRRDIDGLRAVAVILVVLYHAFPEIVPGGFIGVDIFFVISGYLISTIIIQNIEHGTFGFGDFYARRIRRIFPALIVVLATCGAVGWLVLLPSGYKQFGNQLLGGATFVSNLVLWHESGYFDISSELKPLLHLWSLGVEEQFYLLWPLALWIAWRAGFSAVKLTWIILLLSLCLSLALVRNHPVADFYSPATRFWELMLGCVLANASLSRKSIEAIGGVASARPESLWTSTQKMRRMPNARSLLGIALVVIGAFFLNKGRLFPGAWAALPTVGAYLLISAGPAAFVNRRILSSPVFVFIGLISYPLYLWHWPLLSFARIYQTQPVGVSVRVMLVLLSTLLAWATYRFIEQPLRFGKKKAQFVAALSSAMVVVAAAGLAIIFSNGFPTRLNEAARRYANYPADAAVGGRVNTCWLTEDHPSDAYAKDCVDSDSARHRPLMMVWGDSHAARLFIGLREIEGNSVRMAQYTRSSCPPFLIYPGLYQKCIDANAFILRRIAELKPEVVVLFGYWELYSQPRANAVAIADALNITIGRLKELGIAKIIVVGPAPRWNTSLPDNLVRMQLSHSFERVPERTFYGLDRLTVALDVDLRTRLGKKADVLYFSMYGALCNERGCLTHVGDDLDALTSMDYGHLTEAGALYAARKLQTQSDNFWERPVAPEIAQDTIFAPAAKGQPPNLSTAPGLPAKAFSPIQP